MKRLTIILSGLLLALLCTSAYLLYAIISLDKFPLTESLTFIYVFFLLLEVLVYLLNLKVSERIAKLDTLFFLLACLFATVMFLSRDTVDSLWNTTLSLYIFQAGRLAFRLVPDSTAISIPSRWIVILATGLIEYILLCKSSGEIYYAIGGITFLLLALVLILGIFIRTSPN